MAAQEAIYGEIDVKDVARVCSVAHRALSPIVVERKASVGAVADIKATPPQILSREIGASSLPLFGQSNSFRNESDACG